MPALDPEYPFAWARAKAMGIESGGITCEIRLSGITYIERRNTAIADVRHPLIPSDSDSVVLVSSHGETQPIYSGIPMFQPVKSADFIPQIKLAYTTDSIMPSVNVIDGHLCRLSKVTYREAIDYGVRLRPGNKLYARVQGLGTHAWSRSCPRSHTEAVAYMIAAVPDMGPPESHVQHEARLRRIAFKLLSDAWVWVVKFETVYEKASRKLPN